MLAMMGRPKASPVGDAALGAGIGRSFVLLLAVATGAAVANLYYAQPLLRTLAHAFGVSDATAALLVTITQVGYVVGLALVVPLGDLRERRRLITVTMLISAAGLALAAAAPTFTVFGAALGVVGLTSVVAQVIVPMSASLAAEDQRGRVVGTVMSGLLVGILLARTVSGLLAAALGWRGVFWLAAAVMLVLAATLRWKLPRVPPTARLPYTELLRSVITLTAAEPVLRQRMLIGAMSFGCFSTLWTSLTFLLAGAPFDYGNAVIGLFGLAGLAGASAASVAGRLADRGWLRQTTTATAVIMLLSWAVLAAGKSSVSVLIIGIVFLDLGVQGLHISNQSAIYALAPEARSRLTTAYMVSCFAGGAVLSALSSLLYAGDGWYGVCILGAVAALVALAVWALTETRVVAQGRRQVSAAARAGGAD
jgi:predicted MFS family arabinose efflux permease